MPLSLKMTNCLRQAVEYGSSHVGQDVPIEHVPNGSEVYFTTPLYILKVMYVFPMRCQYK
jgi:hypothetical protein